VIRTYRSEPLSPAERGRDFGRAHATEVGRAAERYADVFAEAAGGPVDVAALGREAMESIRAWCPASAAEIEGIAAGAGLAVETVAALNARTEVLASVSQPVRGECSTLVSLGKEPASVAAIQTWDWFEQLADNWLVWTIEHPDGRVVHTLTEYGILGKIGVNSSGLGLLLNILHHESDGGPIGVPVHVVARALLDSASDLNQALVLVAGARVSASSALTLVASAGGERTALTAELYPGGPGLVLPDARGVLIHTNHFVARPADIGDRERIVGPDSFFRYEILQRRLAEASSPSVDELLAALHSHLGGGGAVCCHPDPSAPPGSRYATLATVLLHVEEGTLTVREGGPCAEQPATWNPTRETPSLSA
jgi:isopenicillin-N N-acyltransferase-like protein